MQMRSGLSKSQFETLYSSLPSLKEKFRFNDMAKDALFMYLMKIRTGNTDDEIAAYFGFHRTTVELKIKTVRGCLMRDFTPRNINFELSHENLIAHTSKLSQCIFSPHNPNVAITIWDGTYIYVEKSGQHEFQKNSYSSHKKRNYIKPMMIISTDGTILAVLGPFKASENDAKIASTILRDGHPSLDGFQTGDYAILDRGFRDCVHDFQSRGFIVKTPACQPLGKQLSTLEANHSRLVTKVRYDVERINGMVKGKFKIFAQVWRSLSIPHLMNDFEIAAALLNKFFIKSNEDKKKSEEIASKMLARVSIPNTLGQVVNGKAFKRLLNKNNLAEMEALEIFPKMELNDLREISFGDYQIYQAKLYGYDHIKSNDNTFKVSIFCDEVIEKYFKDYIEADPALIMLNIGSRFVSSKYWKAYVLFSRIASGSNAILGYCCSCKVGLRTVGCCSHVMTALYYLGYAQFNGGISQKAKHLKNIFIYEN